MMRSASFKIGCRGAAAMKAWKKLVFAGWGGGLRKNAATYAHAQNATCRGGSRFWGGPSPGATKHNGVCPLALACAFNYKLSGGAQKAKTFHEGCFPYLKSYAKCVSEVGSREAPVLSTRTTMKR